MGHDPLEEMANAIDRETVMLREGSPEWMRKRIATLEAQLAEREGELDGFKHRVHRRHHTSLGVMTSYCDECLKDWPCPERKRLDAARGEEGSGDD